MSVDDDDDCATADENGDCEFATAHDPFEPVYYWQFVHAVCELASAVYDAPEHPPASDCGLMASALRQLFADHVKPDVVPASYGERFDEIQVKFKILPASQNRVCARKKRYSSKERPADPCFRSCSSDYNLNSDLRVFYFCLEFRGLGRF